MLRNSKSIKVNLILQEIATLRKCLDEVSHHVESLCDPAIVVISQKLDDRLNQYIKLQTKPLSEL
jgi:hypothetical protein